MYTTEMTDLNTDFVFHDAEGTKHHHSGSFRPAAPEKNSPVEITTNCLDRIERLNPTINAFITVMYDSALAEARAAEAEINAGNWRGPLLGIPIGLEDLNRYGRGKDDVRQRSLRRPRSN